MSIFLHVAGIKNTLVVHFLVNHIIQLFVVLHVALNKQRTKAFDHDFTSTIKHITAVYANHFICSGSCCHLVCIKLVIALFNNTLNMC